MNISDDEYESLVKTNSDTTSILHDVTVIWPWLTTQYVRSLIFRETIMKSCMQLLVGGTKHDHNLITTTYFEALWN